MDFYFKIINKKKTYGNNNKKQICLNKDSSKMMDEIKLFYSENTNFGEAVKTAKYLIELFEWKIEREKLNMIIRY